MIIGLHNEEGNWINSEEEIEGVAVSYFNDLFLTFSPSGFDSFFGTSSDFWLQKPIIFGYKKRGKSSTIYDASGKDSMSR